MTLTINLPFDVQERLEQEAKRRGLAADQVTVRLLDQYLPAKDQSTELGALLQSWIDDEDPGEQKETGDYLIRALDEDRPSNRKLFPPDLEGVTW